MSFADSITKVPMYYINLYKIVPQMRAISRASFYTYKGCLTNPPCYQSVKWIVLENPVSTSREGVGMFYRQCYCYYIHMCSYSSTYFIHAKLSCFAEFSNQNEWHQLIRMLSAVCYTNLLSLVPMKYFCKYHWVKNSGNIWKQDPEMQTTHVVKIWLQFRNYTWAQCYDVLRCMRYFHWYDCTGMATRAT